MNKRFLIMLSVAALVILLGAIVAVYYNKSDEGSLSQGSLVFPDLSKHLSDVERVQITSASDPHSFSLQRTDVGWTVKERDNYPANFSKIRELLDQLSQAKFYEPKTSQRENYEALGVADITDKNNSGALVEIFIKNKSEPPYQLLVGKLAATWDGSYVRLPNQPQSWLLDRQISADGLITAWLSNVILSLQSERIYKVTYTSPQKESLIVVRESPNDKHFAVQNLPVGKTIRYEGVADGVPNNFTNILLRDVQSATAHQFNPANIYQIALQTYDGLVVDIQTEKVNERYFLTLRAHFDPALPKLFGVTDVSVTDKVMAEADTLQNKAANWVYEINEHVYVDLTKSMKDVLPE